MDAETFIKDISEKIKLIRVESNLTQDKMADIIGISKKTLVEVEKGRLLLSWPVAVCTVTIFEDCQSVEQILGGDVVESIKSLAFESNQQFKKTLGRKTWWKDIKIKNGFILQQNIISSHYRILDSKNYRLYSSFNEEYILGRLEYLAQKNKGEK